MASDKQFYEDQYGLPLSEVDHLGIEFLSPSETKELAPHYYKARAMKINYHNSDGSLADFHRIRYLDLSEIQEQLKENTGGFTRSKESKSVLRYHQPSGHDPMLYYSKYMDWSSVITTSTIPIILTEGEMKANAACKHKLPTISMGGVWNWKSKKTGIIQDFKDIDWKERDVWVIFDSDVATKPQVKHAMYSLCTALTSMGAIIRYGGVYHTDMDENPNLKLGIDDYLSRYGIDEFKKFLKSNNLKEFSKSIMLHKYNSMFAYVRNKVRVLEFKTGNMIKHNDFTGVHKSNEYIMLPKDPSDENSKLIRKKLSTEWLAWEQRLELEDLVYKPGEDKIIDNKYYNKWNGWRTKPKEGDTSMWDVYLEHVFGSEKEPKEWLESWIAHQFQFPGVKMYTAVALWSPENGSGKSLGGYIIRSVMGKENAGVVNDETLKNDYAGHLKEKQFILGDELLAGERDKRKSYDRFKGMISNEEQSVNIKFQPMYQTEDCTNYWFTSNHPNAYYLDEHDRRFFVWRIRGGVMDEAWAKKFETWWKSEEGRSALMHRWQTKDIKGFNPKGAALKTGDRAEMIETGMTEVEFWLTQFTESVMSSPQNDDWLTAKLTNGPDVITSEMITGRDIYNLCKEARSSGMKLSIFNGKLGSLKLVKFHGGNPINLGAHGKHRFYIIRNLSKWLNASLEEGKEYLTQQADKNQILFKSYGDFSANV